jgi:4-deoxy-L-threo-5-hexosulose-uronate ketol-isomerase
MRQIQVADAVRYPRMTQQELRDAFLVDGLFHAGRIDLVYVDLDRTVVGSAVPLGEPLRLETDPDLRAEYFLERRELGVMNIGGPGTVYVDGEELRLAPRDAVYVGRGAHDVLFASVDAACPAEFYLLSYPAHAVFPTIRIAHEETEQVTLGSAETSNRRIVRWLIHLGGTRSSQLVMGVTELAPGSVWNTMPPHTHVRRSEIYFYFDLPESERVLHLMGPANQTRHIIVANKQAIIAPGWSIHAGVGTSNYAFCLGMGGENQVHSDTDLLTAADLI